MKKILAILLTGMLLKIAVCAQSIQPIYSFTNGAAYPFAGLTLGTDGNFYGTTSVGTNAFGTGTEGTVFQWTTNGCLNTLGYFTGTNGADPQGSLALGLDGSFYGTTGEGGISNFGTVFKVTSYVYPLPPRQTYWVLTTLASFTGTNGETPIAGLTLGADGNFYGTTELGGSYGNANGTVFQVTTNGVLTTLVNFDSTNGAWPYGGLALGPDGDLYGTTELGGSGGPRYGTVFKVTTNGVLTTLVNFDSTNGANPYAVLTLGPDGNFYGTTGSGGSNGYGTVFEVTTNGTLTTLANFTYANGAHSLGALALGADGNFYGSTDRDGSNGYGTVYEVTTNGVLTTLASFDLTNGANPHSGLTLGTDGNFYGTAEYGGSDGDGDIYRLELPPDLAVEGTNQAVFQGSNAVVTVTPFGSPPFTYEWLSNGVMLASGPASTFTITNTTLAALTNYQVLIMNDSGMLSLNLGNISAIQSPLFIQQPADQIVPIGSAAVFNGPAAGNAPLAYQWYYEAMPVAGATSAGLSISPALTNDAGCYQLVVTNLYGSITSQMASLTVLLQPNSYDASNDANGNLTVFLASYPGSTNRLWATTNAALPIDQWQVVATNVMDANGLSQFMDTNTAGINEKYYRLSMP